MKIRKSNILINHQNRRTIIKDEFCRDYGSEERLTQPQSIATLMDDVFHMSEQAEEYVYIICMTCKATPIRFFEVSHGTQTMSVVDPKAILTRTLLSGATNYVIVHNHPSGDPQPSKADIELSARIMDASRLVGVEMLDHIIIGDGKYFSFREASLPLREKKYAKHCRKRGRRKPKQRSLAAEAREEA